MPNIDLNPYDWEEIKHILNTFVPGYEVWAFGSRVTWTAKAYSDLDIAIITEKSLSLSELARLKEAFDDSTISIKVDVVDWASTSESFRKIIEKKKVLLQEAVTTKAGWKVEKLIDCTRDGNLSYGIVQPGQQDPNGIPIVRVNNFKDGQLQLDDMLKVSAEIESKYRRTRLVGGEVLLTLVGSTGQSAVVPKEMVGGNIARAVAVIRPKPDIGANWINICLQTKVVQRFLDERANTTVQKTLNLADVREIPIPIPPRAVKEQIEAVAMALADKIELNHQINQTLEQIAQTIFKSWFVDFEPVKAKIKAKAGGRDLVCAATCAISGKLESELDQLPPEQRQQLVATAALFPDALVESELGLIPQGWEVKSLAEMVQLTGGGTPKRSNPEFWGGDIPWFSVQDAPADGDVFVVDTEEKITKLGLEKSSTRLLPIGTTIISARGTVGRLALVGVEMAMNQSCYGVEGADGVGPYFNYFNLKGAVSTLQQNTHGAVFDTITRQTFETVSCVRPTKSVLEGFEVIMAPLMRSICSNVHERRTLASLRDVLIPKLLSGELELEKVGVGDVELNNA